MNLQRIIVRPNGTNIKEIMMTTQRDYDGFSRLATLILTGNLPGHKVLDRSGNEIEIRHIPIDISGYSAS